MSVKYILTFAAGTAPARDPKRSLMSAVSTPAAALDPTTNQIVLYFGDTVSKRRRTEIINTWKWLFSGIKERNLLDKTPWNAQAMVTCVNLNDRSIADRRTSATVAAVTFSEANDVMLAWGASVAPGGMTQDLRSAVFKLIRFANENKTLPL